MKIMKEMWENWNWELLSPVIGISKCWGQFRRHWRALKVSAIPGRRGKTVYKWQSIRRQASNSRLVVNPINWSADAREFTELVIKFDRAIPNNIGHFSDRCDGILRDAEFRENSRIAIVRSRGRPPIDISSRYYDATARYYACFRVSSRCAAGVNVTTGVAHS